MIYIHTHTHTHTYIYIYMIRKIVISNNKTVTFILFIKRKINIMINKMN